TKVLRIETQQPSARTFTEGNKIIHVAFCDQEFAVVRKRARRALFIPPLAGALHKNPTPPPRIRSASTLPTRGRVTERADRPTQQSTRGDVGRCHSNPPPCGEGRRATKSRAGVG